ncbi:hypothetical protein IHE44_0013713 [Lamprotornis superbus]|uniref:Serpin domain-containing protein n=1 Tax=Lamprotornis superbus TaxID=245042 RepID=A0A835P2C4_9PASS|nr:hypothetical protein IHE44_0013713 [Lamprotornis superbus]
MQTFTADGIHPHCIGFFELSINVTNSTQTSYVEAVLENEPGKSVFFSLVSLSTAFALLSLVSGASSQAQALEGIVFNLPGTQKEPFRTMKSALYLCLLLLGLQVQGQQQEQIHPSPEHQSQADIENLPYVKLAPSNADFAFKLYKQIRDEVGNGNIFFSPLSISTAFAMLTLGARSNTLRELHKGLAFNLTQMEEQEIHEGFQHILQLLNDPHREAQLNMGNALFVDKQVELLQNFLDGATNFYYTEAVSSNFQNPPEVVKEINKYVETKTHGKIVDLVKSLEPGSVMVLINYLFFKVWIILSSSRLHKPSLFPCTMDQTVAADTNFISRDLAITNSHFYLFLKREIYLDLPRFSVSGSYDLKSLFEKMDVTEVFSDQADLSGVAKNLLLKVSKAIHKATVDVRENGTEAAAVTMLEIMPMSLPFPPPPRITFNRAFLMMIIDKTTDGLLFLGKILWLKLKFYKEENITLSQDNTSRLRNFTFSGATRKEEKWEIKNLSEEYKEPLVTLQHTNAPRQQYFRHTDPRERKRGASTGSGLPIDASSLSVCSNSGSTANTHGGLVEE